MNAPSESPSTNERNEETLFPSSAPIEPAAEHTLPPSWANEAPAQPPCDPRNDETLFPPASAPAPDATLPPQRLAPAESDSLETIPPPPAVPPSLETLPPPPAAVPRAAGTVTPASDPTPPIMHVSPAGGEGTTLPPGQAPTAPAPRRAEFPVIAGYDVLRELGRGGMGVVYQARQRGLNRLVALKMIIGGAYADEESLARFRAEAEAIARFQHLNIVQVYEIGEQDGLPYFSLEFVDGGSLDGKLKGALLADRAAAQLMETLARAMHAAHEAGIVHRDLKPANVLMAGPKDAPPDRCVPKITDFGLAKKVGEDSGQTQAGAVMGTPSYMAPEQARGKVHLIGPLADVYALGAMLYELLTGRPPFRAASVWDTLEQVTTQEPVPPRQLQPKVSRDLETICLKCLQKEPAARYASAEALADDLRRYLDGEPIQARPTPPWLRAWKWARRRPMAAGAIGLAAALLLTMLGFFWVSAEIARRDLAEERRNQQATEAVKDLLRDGESALAVANWQDAERKIAAARELVSHNPALESLHDPVEQLAGRVNEGRTVRGQVEAFTAHRNEALLRTSQATGQEADDAVATTRREARAALDVFGAAPAATAAAALKGPYLTDREKRAIEAGRYELLVILADAIGRPQPGEDARTQAGQALELLDQARRLGQPTQSCFRRIAHYQEVKGDAAAAREAARQADALPPSTAVDFFLLGEQAHRQGDWSGAVAHFEQALRREPDYFWAHYYIGLCELNARRYARAEAEMGTCMYLRPKFVWAYLVRALARAELGNLAKFDPTLTPAERQRQSKHAFEGGEADLVRAEAELGTVKDDRYNWLVNRGLLRIRAERYGDALTDLRKATELKPQGVEALATLAMAFQSEKKWAEAVGQLDTALAVLEKLPANATKYQRQLSLLRQRAFCQRERGDVAATLRDLEAVIKLEGPRQQRGELSAFQVRALAQDHYERGRLLYQEKRYADALPETQRVRELTPEDTRATRLQAGILYEMKRYKDAVAAFDAYLDQQKGKKTPGVYAGRGLARWREHNFTGAIEDFTQALALESDEVLSEPELARLHADRGWIYLLDGDAPKLALDDFNQVLQRKPDDADALAGRSFARVKLGQYTLAVADADLAVRQAPEDARILYLAARTCAQASAAAEADTRERLHHELAVRYEVRALALLQQALDRTPTAQRPAYWQNTLRRDRALVPLHRTAAFRQIDGLYGAAPK